ncbi:MAG: hypothetical protein PHI97_12130 [Desulfobulbus sp.]|nr:hypothetical protein [Desulfobulbus sp.]
MNTTNTKKKIMMAAILTSGLTLAISQAVMAQPDKHGGHGPKGREVDAPCQYQMNSELKKAQEKFLTDTVTERKALAQKSAEMRAIMKAGTPDTTKASEVAGELFELREKMRLKAQESNVPLPMLLMGQGGDGMMYHDGAMMHHTMQ